MNDNEIERLDNDYLRGYLRIACKICFKNITLALSD